MQKTFTSYLTNIKKNIKEVDSQFILNSNSVVIDIRESEEIVDGIIPKSIHLSKGMLELKIESTVPLKDQSIVLYCAGGIRSTFAANVLKEMGYTQIYSLRGGIKGWKDEGYPLEILDLSNIQNKQRYSAQIKLPEIGMAGQMKLQQARVLIVGAGGLGSPAALYLAAAGVGTIGIMDDDIVDLSNLQRQVLHTTDRIKLNKVDSAFLTLQNLNPSIKIEPICQRLDANNVDSLFSRFDIILDGCDNFKTRYLINDACLKHKKPNVHGSIFKFQGQVSIFCEPGGPCYRCLFAEPPNSEVAPNCAEAGVLGVLPGVLGVIEATEVIKLILNIGQNLKGRLLSYDALTMSFEEMKIKKNEKCFCSQDSQLIKYSNYEEFCSGV